MVKKVEKKPTLEVSTADLRNAVTEAERLNLDGEGEQVEADVEEAPEASQDKLDKIVALAEEQKRLVDLLERLDAKTNETKKLLTNNKMNLLPAAMSEAEMISFELKDGWVVEVQKVVNAGIPSATAIKKEKSPEKKREMIERKETAIAYMDKEAPDLVKNTIIIDFPKGEEKFFNKFMADLRKRKVEIKATVERAVNASTLGKWVKERDKAGLSVDETLLNVSRVTIAEVEKVEIKK